MNSKQEGGHGPREVELPPMAAGVIKAVRRAYWRAIQSALDRDSIDGYSGELWQDFEDSDTGELIGNGGD
jgi:hypothetical protein